MLEDVCSWFILGGFFGHRISIAAIEFEHNYTESHSKTKEHANFVLKRIHRSMINFLSISYLCCISIVSKQVPNDKSHEIIALTQCTNPADQN